MALDYFRVFGRAPDLDNPRGFNELMQASKIGERDWRLPVLVNKLLVKDHVRRLLGPEWVTPTLWSGDDVSATMLRRFPKPAVLKANHASGVMIFLDQNTDFARVARRANDWLKYDYHLLHREWAYAFVERRLLIEPLIAAPDQLTDFKYWMVNGEVCLVQVDQSRFSFHTRQFYDANWKRLDLQMNYPKGEVEVARPRHFEAMSAAAKALARGHNFVRVDLYSCADGPRFGELTFWPEAGLCRWRRRSFDVELGALVRRAAARAPLAEGRYAARDFAEQLVEPAC